MNEIYFIWIIIGVLALVSLIFEFVYLKEGMVKQAKRELINLILVGIMALIEMGLRYF